MQPPPHRTGFCLALQVRFSPDGRWVVSGGEDGSVKLWDLTAGKLMHDFASHEGDVTAVDYHPSEFLLATGSADRTVKFWDLETFELVASTPPEATPVRAITFTPDGRSLLSATQDSLKVPIRIHACMHARTHSRTPSLSRTFAPIRQRWSGPVERATLFGCEGPRKNVQ
jgi:WD40 repeat protein